MVLLLFLKFALFASLVTSTAYNETEARILLDLAAAAYSHVVEPCVNRTLSSNAQWKIYTELFSICDVADSICSGYVLRSDVQKKIIIIFRGTRTREQLLIQGKESLTPGVDFLGIGKVNKYFKNALDSLWPRIEPLLKDDVFKHYEVSFTGHSLGGALASLAAVRTVLQKYRDGRSIKLYTFGEPRTGSRDYALKHDELLPNSFRVVHRADIVPHLPPCRKVDTGEDEDKSRPCDPTDGSSPYHHGVEIWYPNSMGKGAKYITCLGEPKNEDFGCSDNLTFKLVELKEYVKDHRIYFDHFVTKYGKLGCVDLPDEESAKLLSMQQSGTDQKSAKTSKSIFQSAFTTFIGLVKSLKNKF